MKKAAVVAGVAGAAVGFLTYLVDVLSSPKPTTRRTGGGSAGDPYPAGRPQELREVKDLYQRGAQWKRLAEHDWPTENTIPDYDSCLAKAKDLDEEVLNSIERDVNRTMPQHPSFMAGSDGVDRLRRLLQAYAAADAGTRYVQGMNAISGHLLLHSEERDAFSLLYMLMNSPKLNLRSLFADKLPALHALVAVLPRCLEENDSKLARHLKRLKVNPMQFCVGWIMTFFVNGFPSSVTDDIWDCILENGREMFLRVSIVLIEQCRKALLEADSTVAAIQCLKTYLTILEDKHSVGFIAKVMSVKISPVLLDEMLSTWETGAPEPSEEEEEATAGGLAYRVEELFEALRKKL